jgi:hypothetical protein
MDDKGKEGFSRRTALKGLSGIIAAATLPVNRSAATPTPQAAPQTASSPRSTSLTKNRSTKPNILWITGEGCTDKCTMAYAQSVTN